jgi:hypothetical protein
MMCGLITLILVAGGLYQLQAQQPRTMNVFNSVSFSDENRVTLQDGDILHLNWAGPDGQIDPPVMNIGGVNNGQPTGDDELLETHVIGENSPPGFGQFVFMDTTYQNQSQGKPAQGDWIYIRAFNDNNLVTATYYGDAQLYKVVYVNGENYDANIGIGTDTPLPIELSNFEAFSGNEEVLLKWVTQSELNNLGFEVCRSLEKEDEYGIIASYETMESLQGAGNSNEEHHYSFKDLQVVNGTTYWYKLADVDYTGIRTYHDPISAIPNINQSPLSQTGGLPNRFMLYQNYPNPFNPETTIKFELPDLANNLQRVELLIFNSLGMKVRTLYSGLLAPAVYKVKWDGRSDNARQLSSGIYFTCLKAGSFSQTGKMLLVR